MGAPLRAPGACLVIPANASFAERIVVARASSCQAGTFDHGGTCTSCPPVGDVTVCPEESSDLRNITLLGFFPMSGGWTGGIQALPATELAIERLNADASILPRHRVRLAWNDTQCSVAKGVELTQSLLHAHPTAAAIVGGGCSGVCAAGYYCPEGSTSATQRECGGEHLYCPAGSGAPVPVPSGSYSSGGTHARSSFL